MSPNPRHQALRSIPQGASASNGMSDHRSISLPDLFGSKVFNDSVQRRRLPKDVYQALRQTIERGEELSPAHADAVADAMKDWAVEHGATHYTHWFQPMTGLTAEKHDSFLSPVAEGGAIHSFTGKELIKGEPDASSFPSGGIRATFEARGYTAWDPTSPAFLRESTYGVTLCIPTAFCSWTGEALDTKTPLLRSSEALDRQARRLLAVIDEPAVQRVFATVGPEQEYFLVDRKLYQLRPDLLACHRTLLGARPPKGQELEDHYFSTTPERVIDFMMDLERELWRLGVPVKTRHSEVAPHQFELAPLYEHVSLATDHNMLTMEMMQTVADRHGLKCLLHEKPFAGVNGSGKHNNWSMADDRGHNLLEPGHTPHENRRFVVCLTAIIKAVDEHQDLIRASIASAGNDHRLGANEAPPAIISIFLGSELEAVVDSLMTGAPLRARERGEIKLGVTTLPPLPQDTTDRNRTSPFAFTGNKFEFRAVGSYQSIAYPNIIINTAVAAAMDAISNEIEARIAKGTPKVNAIQEVVRDTLTKHQRILFSGDNYSAEWEAEAKRRGLLNLRDTPSALADFASEANIEFFERYGVFSRRETLSRSNVMHLGYVHRISVEALSLHQIASTSILPAAMRYQHELAQSIQAARSVSGTLQLEAQESLLAEVAGAIGGLHGALAVLKVEHHEGEQHAADPVAAASRARDRVIPAMERVRRYCDELETLIDDALWPLPKYRELLFVH